MLRFQEIAAVFDRDGSGCVRAVATDAVGKEADDFLRFVKNGTAAIAGAGRVDAHLDDFAGGAIHGDPVLGLGTRTY